MSSRLLVWFCIFCGLAVFLQWRAGAFVAEFDGNDEAAHVVTSLMVHDYVAAGMHGSPRKFAEGYYVRYPRVAFGVWPPLFHLSQAAWMLITTPSRISVLMLMGLWAGVLATGCFFVVRNRFGFAAALAMGLLLVTLPEVQEATHSVMADLMMSSFMFGATLFFWRYLRTENGRDSFLFGLLASVAILVKYNALCLALVPVFALLFTRRFYLLKRFSFWLPAIVVAMLCGPWYVIQWDLVQYAMEPKPGFADIPAAMWANSVSMARIAGAPLFALALIGVISRLRSPKSDNGIWAAGASLIASLWFFHSVLFPLNDTRYLLSATPFLLLFAVAGCYEVARWAAPRLRFASPPLGPVLAAACAAYVLFTFHIARKEHFGIAEVASQLLHSDSPGATLVSGRATIEGMLISEMAMDDRAQQHGILRASKVLASSTWMGANYRLKYQTPEEIGRFLEKAPVTRVVLDKTSTEPPPHHALLEKALAADPGMWMPEQMSPNSPVQIFDRAEAPTPAAAAVYLDLTPTLKKSLEAPRVR
jgi:hypothetical protein